MNTTKTKDNSLTMWGAPWIGAYRWTNNNCESANNLLKLALDWKPARLTDLVQYLHYTVKVQYASVQRALIGQGDFVLAEAFAHHRVPFCHWQSFTDERRRQIVQAFMLDKGACAAKSTKQNTVTSS